MERKKRTKAKNFFYEAFVSKIWENWIIYKLQKTKLRLNINLADLHR
jgi:hypothetical protein